MEIICNLNNYISQQLILKEMKQI